MAEREDTKIIEKVKQQPTEARPVFASTLGNYALLFRSSSWSSLRFLASINQLEITMPSSCASAAVLSPPSCHSLIVLSSFVPPVAMMGSVGCAATLSTTSARHPIQPVQR